MYDKERADHAINFIRNLKHTKGKWHGVPFDLLPWQEKIIRDVFGTIKPDRFRQYNTAYIEIPKKNGKALALNTPLPTPTGWTTMGAIQVGDALFDEHGQSCRVMAATEIMYNRRCYEVVFSDGSKIVADEQHQWKTHCWKTGRVKGKRFIEADYIHTTKEIRDTICLDAPHNIKNNLVSWNHRIQVAAPLDLIERDLLIHPYILGVWLGDGASASASFTCSYSDMQMLQEIKQCGLEVYEWRSNNENSGHYHIGKRDRTQKGRNQSVQAKLKALNLLHNKYIPVQYLRASVNQRLFLLQGLMDTDGYISEAGQCEFTTTSPALRDGAMELIISLGMKPLLSTRRAILNGKDCGEKYRIQFYAFADFPVFRLQRKKDRLKSNPGKVTRSMVRHIVAVNPVPSVPIRCIQVDSPSYLYLAGWSMIPTHNSELAAGVALDLLCNDGEWGAEVYGCASERGQASIVFDVAVDMVDQCPALKKRIKPILSVHRLVYKPTNSFYQVCSSEAFSKHGLNVHGVVFDELHAQPNRKLYDVMTTGAGDARTQPLFFLITMAGDDPDHTSIGWEVHNEALEILAGTKIDPTFYPVIYGLDAAEDWEDEKNWLKANPSIGHTITIEKVRAQYIASKGNLAKERNFCQLRLNQWPTTKNASKWLGLDLWDATAGLVAPEKLKGRKCYGGLDLSSRYDLTSDCLLFPPVDDDPRWYVLWDFWIPEENMKERVARDKVPYDTWKKSGFIKTTPGNVIDYNFIKAATLRRRDEFEIVEIGFDPWNANQVALQLTDEGLTMVEVRQGFKSMSPAMKEIETLVRGGNLIHGGNPVARWNFGNLVVKQDENENFRPIKSKVTERIDGITALINAMARAIVAEKEESPGIIVL